MAQRPHLTAGITVNVSAIKLHDYCIEFGLMVWSQTVKIIPSLCIKGGVIVDFTLIPGSSHTDALVLWIRLSQRQNETQQFFLIF